MYKCTLYISKCTLLTPQCTVQGRASIRWQDAAWAGAVSCEVLPPFLPRISIVPWRPHSWGIWSHRIRICGRPRGRIQISGEAPAIEGGRGKKSAEKEAMAIRGKDPPVQDLRTCKKTFLGKHPVTGHGSEQIETFLHHLHVHCRTIWASGRALLKILGLGRALLSLCCLDLGLRPGVTVATALPGLPWMKGKVLTSQSRLSSMACLDCLHFPLLLGNLEPSKPSCCCIDTLLFWLRATVNQHCILEYIYIFMVQKTTRSSFSGAPNKLYISNLNMIQRLNLG